MYKFTEYFGWLNLVSVLLLFMAMPFIDSPPFHEKGSLLSVLVIQFAVSAAIVYASRQKQQGTDIGEKAYPASLASYVLFILIVYQWTVDSIEKAL